MTFLGRKVCFEVYKSHFLRKKEEWDFSFMGKVKENL
jgi:hypothetical protein